jgi:hypothetical protein
MGGSRTARVIAEPVSVCDMVIMVKSWKVEQFRRQLDAEQVYRYLDRGGLV